MDDDDWASGITDADFEYSDRTIEQDDVDTLPRVPVREDLKHKYKEMFVNWDNNEFYGVPINSPTGLPILIPRSEWMEPEEYARWVNPHLKYGN